MRAVVVGVGDELLSGLVVNTNAAMCGELLLAAGVPVVRQYGVGDDEDEIVTVLREAGRLAPVVIVTGGLGPTQDDRTRDALARLLDTDLVRDEEILEDIRERFRRFGREMPEANAKQADVPRGARAILNPYGTAPGVRAEVGNTIYYAIPGVPGEARHMLTERVIPELAERFEEVGTIRTREIRTVGVAEAELAGTFDDLADGANPRMAFLPSGGEVRLRFIASAPTPEECESMLDGAESIVRGRLGDAVYGTGDDSLEAVVGNMLRARGLTVATAESCTAGLLAARIANAPGAGDYLRGGVVGYQTDAKAQALGVPEELLERCGAVSSECAEAMAAGVRRELGADVGLSVTCVAGPDTQDGRDVGTTFLGLADAEGVQVRQLRLPGDREQIRGFATTFSLNLLRLHLLR